MRPRAVSCLVLAAVASAGAARARVAESPPAPAGETFRLLQPPPSARLTEPSPDPPPSVARRFLRDRVTWAGELVLLGTVQGAGGVRFVDFEQRFGGVPVDLSRTSVAVGPDGSVRAARVGQLVSGLSLPAAPAVTDAASARRHAASARDARGRALRAAEGAVPQPVLVATERGAELAYRVPAAPLSDATAEHDVLVAAVDGRVVRVQRTHFDGVVAARVWPRDPLRPSAWVSFPEPATNPSYHSPLGWTDDLEASGNNAHVVLDRAGERDPAGPTAVAFDDPPVLDFPFTGDPREDVDAALTNVFRALSFAHDRFRELGFDEQSGAFQQDNYGRGGVGGDRVVAFVQFGSGDGSVPTNVVRLTLGNADGSAPQLIVGVFDLSDGEGILKDAAFETDLLIHEYAHGVLVRMLGSAGCFNGRHPSALAEGWADFFAASFTDDPVIGAWLADDEDSGLRTTSLAESSRSLANFCFNGCNAQRDGELWSATLWDLRRALVQARGAPGATLAEAIAFEALRYVPCQPTMLDARDALLLADLAVTGGENHCLIWQVARGRGMGVGASATGPADDLPVPGFTPPLHCVGAATIRWDSAEYGVFGGALLEVLDETPPADPRVSVETSAGDAESLALSSVGGPYLRVEVPLSPGAPVPGDGVLQVVSGDTLTATHVARGITATAAVSDDMQIQYLLHYVLGSECQGDDDHEAAPGYLLPGFVDAGEAADVLFLVETRSRGDLLGAEVELESLNPRLAVGPSVVPLGTIRAAPEGGTRNVIFAATLAAASDVTQGEQAELVLRFRSEGRTAESRVVLTLHQDYVLEEGLSPFQAGVETFDADSPTAAGWTHRAIVPGPDAWGLQDCAGAGGTPGAANAGADCRTYPDDQGDPVFVSPALIPTVPGDAVAWRVREVAWRHRNELFFSPDRELCEADMVAAFLTEDVDGLPHDDPVGVLLDRLGDPLATILGLTATDTFVDVVPDAVDTTPKYLAPGQQLDLWRLAFVFWSDVVDAATDPGCTAAANQGRYLLEDVRFAYEIVRQVPEPTTCEAECRVLVEGFVDPARPLCPGEVFTIDVGDTEAVGCDALRYSFVGPGVPPDRLDTAETSSTAVFEPGGAWFVTARCVSGPTCAVTAEVGVTHAAAPGLGGPFPGTLRARRRDAEVVFAWRGAAAPAAYGLFRATTRRELIDGAATWSRVADADGEGPAGDVEVRLSSAGEPVLGYYRAFARDPCTGAAIIP